MAGRLEGLLDEPRPGRPRTVSDEQVEAVITATLGVTDLASIRISASRPYVGTKPPIKSSPASAITANELTTHDTRRTRHGWLPNRRSSRSRAADGRFGTAAAWSFGNPNPMT